jgi:hypothetical protein
VQDFIGYLKKYELASTWYHETFSVKILALKIMSSRADIYVATTQLKSPAPSEPSCDWRTEMNISEPNDTPMQSGQSVHS